MENIPRPDTIVKQCFWCGTLGDLKNRVTVSEDVPPRWLSGERKVKRINCVPQCDECKNALARLDDSVNTWFRFGAGIDLDIVEQDNFFRNNKGYISRKINLHGEKDYAQSNPCLLLWLRKLLLGLWYKEKKEFFNGNTYILAHWVTEPDPNFYLTKVVLPKEKIMEIQLDIDIKITGKTYEDDFEKRPPFTFNFISPSRSGVELPLQLLRFSIYGRFTGYCLYFPKKSFNDIFKLLSLYERDPLYLKYWLNSFISYSPSQIITMTNSLKSLSAEEVAKRVR